MVKRLQIPCTCFALRRAHVRANYAGVTPKYYEFPARFERSVLQLYFCRFANSCRLLASFPGPAQLSVACFTVLKAKESWAGPGNEASRLLCTYIVPKMLLKPIHMLKSLVSSLAHAILPYAQLPINFMHVLPHPPTSQKAVLF